MNQHASNINVVLTVDQIANDAITERENSSWLENLHTHFPEGKREVGRNGGGGN